MEPEVLIYILLCLSIRQSGVCRTMKSHFRSGFWEPLKSNLPVNQTELSTPFGSHDPTHSRTCLRYPLARLLVVSSPYHLASISYHWPHSHVCPLSTLLPGDSNNARELDLNYHLRLVTRPVDAETIPRQQTDQEQLGFRISADCTRLTHW